MNYNMWPFYTWLAFQICDDDNNNNDNADNDDDKMKYRCVL